MPRVYLIYHNCLFGDALRAILANQAGIELVGTASNPAQVAVDVNTLLPDVILLEETEGGLAAEDVRAILSSTAHRLITLRLDVAGMHVWEQTWHQMVSVPDLMAAILATTSSRVGEDEP